MSEALFSMAASVISGYLCDRYKRIKPFWYISLVLYCVATWLTYITTELNFLKHMVLVMMVGGLLRVSNGLIDSLTLQTDEQCRNNFGVIRSFGSIGWAVGSPITAIMVEKWGYASLGIGFVISTAILFLLSIGIGDISSTGEREPLRFSETKVLFKNRRYVMVTIILLLFYIVDNSQGYGVVGKMSLLNGTERHVGYYWAMAAMLELPLFFYGNRLTRKYGNLPVMIFMGFMFAIRYFVYGIVKTMAGVFVGGVFQAVTFPLLLVLAKSMIDEETPDHLKTSGQQVAQAIYVSGSALVSPLLSGVLEDNLGINNTLYTMAVIALIATLITMKVMRNK